MHGARVLTACKTAGEGTQTGADVAASMNVHARPAVVGCDADASTGIVGFVAGLGVLA